MSENSLFKNKNILVTGSSRGIGFAIAENFANQGARLMFNARSEDSFSRVRDRFSQHEFFCGDVSQPETCEKLRQQVETQFDRLDALVLNVGSGKSVRPGEETQEEWKRILDLNLLSATTPIEKLKKIILRDQTSIVLISSICGVNPLEGAPLAYSAAKSALNAYTQGLAKTWGKMGVRVNAVAPGNILFPGSVWDRKLKEDQAGTKQMLEKEVALQRLGTPEEIANVVSFLASEKASFITGAIIIADGGQVR